MRLGNSPSEFFPFSLSSLEVNLLGISLPLLFNNKPVRFNEKPVRRVRFGSTRLFLFPRDRARSAFQLHSALFGSQPECSNTEVLFQFGSIFSSNFLVENRIVQIGRRSKTKVPLHNAIVFTDRCCLEIIASLYRF